MIVDDDGPGGKPLTLAQSGAIILYCAEKSGKFLPKDPATRALWPWNRSSRTATDLAPVSGAIFQLEMVAPEKNEAITKHFHKRLINFFTVCDTQLAGNQYLAGDLSVADLQLYPNYFARKALIDGAGGLSNLHRWAAAMAARPGVAKGMKPFG